MTSNLCPTTLNTFHTLLLLLLIIRRAEYISYPFIFFTKFKLHTFVNIFEVWSHLLLHDRGYCSFIIRKGLITTFLLDDTMYYVVGNYLAIVSIFI